MDLLDHHDRTIRDLAARLTPGDPESARALAAVHFERAQLLHGLLGRPDESVAGYEAAIALVAELPGAERDVVRYRSDLGMALQQLGRVKEALAQHDAAVALLEEAVEGSDDAELLADLARVRMDRGSDLEALELPDGAAGEYRRAIEIFERLGAGEEPGNPDLATAHGTLGMLLARRGRLAEALGCFEREIAELVPGEEATDLADARRRRGAALHELGRLEEAVAEYGAAIADLAPSEQFEHDTNDVLRKLGGPRHAPAADTVASLHLARAHALAAMERLAEARDETARAVELWTRSVDEEMTYAATPLLGALARLCLLDCALGELDVVADGLRRITAALPLAPDAGLDDELPRALGGLSAADRRRIAGRGGELAPEILRWLDP